MIDVEITNENLYLLLPSKACHVARMIQETEGGTPLDALSKFYHSKLYKQLEVEETKLWHLGPVALFEELEREN